MRNRNPPKHPRELNWPKVVINKLFNRGSREADFSADEGETDSEFDDEAELCGSDREVADEDNRSGIFPLKTRRRNSETLRAQYINTKELRVCVCTWNVGGRLPPDNLDIEDWLDLEDPADIYVLGFQEIVPLNAGNIFGPEDNRPVPKWESIIRETLNKIRPVKTKFKCHSDPPSPSRFKPSDDVPVIEEELLADTDSESETEVHPVDEGSFTFSQDRPVLENVDLDFDRQSSLKRLNRLNCLKLADNNTLPEAMAAQAKAKLSRMLSSSERVGLSWPEQPFDLLPQLVLDRPNSVKSFKSFKSYRSFKLPVNESSKNLSEAILIPDFDLEAAVNRKRKSNYVRIVSKQMVGIFLTIWVRRNLRKHIQNVKVSTVGVGVMGYIGNKGSVSVSMSIHQTLFCFVCTHLTSGEREGDELKRNADVHEIHRRTVFSAAGVAFPKTIHDHERIFWLGDLNYRINLSYENTREFISSEQWSKLHERDQLLRELKKGRAFDGWSEGTLNFPPTYKYEFNSEKYYGEDPKAGRRNPAWCDRILSYGKGMKLIKYRMIDLRLSDHRPVSASYMVEAEVFCHRKLQKALTLTDAELEQDDDFSDKIDISGSRIRFEELSDWER